MMDVFRLRICNKYHESSHLHHVYYIAWTISHNHFFFSRFFRRNCIHYVRTSTTRSEENSHFYVSFVLYILFNARSFRSTWPYEIRIHKTIIQYYNVLLFMCRTRLFYFKCRKEHSFLYVGHVDIHYWCPLLLPAHFTCWLFMCHGSHLATIVQFCQLYSFHNIRFLCYELEW